MGASVCTHAHAKTNLISVSYRYVDAHCAQTFHHASEKEKRSDGDSVES
jgi:hypothetical protein